MSHMDVCVDDAFVLMVEPVVWDGPFYGSYFPSYDMSGFEGDIVCSATETVMNMELESQKYFAHPSHNTAEVSEESRLLAVQPFVLHSASYHERSVTLSATPSSASRSSASCSSQDDASPPPKKRKRVMDDEVGPADDNRRVYLNRDELLTMSSLEHEEFVKRHTSNQELTEAEKEEVRRQRRLIKNREYAQSSRKKKREEKSDQTQFVLQLRADNEMLRNKVRDLEGENRRLRAALKVKAEPVAPSTRPRVLLALLFSVGVLFAVSGVMPLSLPSSASFAPDARHSGRTLHSVDAPHAPHAPHAFALLPILQSLFGSSSSYARSPPASALSAATTKMALAASNAPNATEHCMAA